MCGAFIAENCSKKSRKPCLFFLQQKSAQASPPRSTPSPGVTGDACQPRAMSAGEQPFGHFSERRQVSSTVTPNRISVRSRSALLIQTSPKGSNRTGPVQRKSRPGWRLRWGLTGSPTGVTSFSSSPSPSGRGSCSEASASTANTPSIEAVILTRP